MFVGVPYVIILAKLSILSYCIFQFFNECQCVISHYPKKVVSIHLEVTNFMCVISHYSSKVHSIILEQFAIFLNVYRVIFHYPNKVVSSNE